MNNPESSETSPKTTFKFVLITIAFSPLWAVAAFLFFLPFAALYAVLGAITAAFVAALVACVAVGVAISLTGIIYGIIKIPSVLPIGLYEIGFGIIVAGVTMVLGILLYNAAVRLMPIIFGLATKLLKLAFNKVKPFLTSYKRWCTER